MFENELYFCKSDEWFTEMFEVKVVRIQVAVSYKQLETTLVYIATSKI